MEIDPKNGIYQSDHYQMLAYTIRIKLVEIMLFYSNTIRDNQDHSSENFIKDELTDGKPITIKFFQLPIINRDLFSEKS